jgi:hypothetical protein
MFNIFLGILGFGYYTYTAARVGIKGFFFAGNEVALIFYCLYYYILTQVDRKDKKILVVYLLALTIALLMATKASVFSCLLISAIDYYMRSSKKKKFYMKLLLPFILLILFILGSYIIPKTEFYQFVKYNITRGLSGGKSILSAILSGRDAFLKAYYEFWKTNSSLTVFLFGLGNSSQKGIEIDFFDVFFTFGIIFLILTTAFYSYLIYLSIKRRNYEMFFFNIIYLVISFFAGHVWFSVSAGLFYAYINAIELKSCHN